MDCLCFCLFKNWLRRSPYSFVVCAKKLSLLSLFNKLLTTVTLLDASSTCTTPLSYSCAILTAVCVLDVVAPPINSGWLTVDTDPTTPATPEGFGTWSPDAAQWTRLQAGGAGTLIYYRVRTRDASDLNERISTQPGNGLWTVIPPYAVLTTDGKSDY